MKILVAVDGSDYTRRTLAFLTEHAVWRSDRNDYTMLHVAAPLPERAPLAADAPPLAGYYQQEADRVLQPVMDFCRQRGIHATATHRVGPVAQEIVGVAEKGLFGLVVLGAQGHGAPDRAALGPVAFEVLARSALPVLLVR